MLAQRPFCGCESPLASRLQEFATITFAKVEAIAAGSNPLSRLELASVLCRKEPMIAAQDILGYLKAQPFRPFRIHMPSGRSFDVRHPEMVRVGRTHLLLFSLVSDNPDIHDRWEMVGLMLIESISFLDAPVA
jgi:hypothetical protein